MDGIFTLGNDRVFDQVISLLNSIEVMLGADFPVCIYPYDDNIEQLTAAIAIPTMESSRKPRLSSFWHSSTLLRL